MRQISRTESAPPLSYQSTPTCPTDAHPVRRPRAQWGKALGFFALIGLALWIGGFFIFAANVGDLQPTGAEQADGIVVLTGGRERIHGAIELLRQGKGRRLLITGVHHSTRSEDLARMGEASPDLLQCCIDLGFEAETTIGNAREAAEWAHRNGFASLIVVTSAYHLPRSLTEFESALPDITLLPYPIHHTDLDLRHWYSEPDAAKLLFGEYVKYTLARIRAQLLPFVPL
jgi:uncharacterized SAM-binding protein YcdF (DUF218 family)